MTGCYASHSTLQEMWMSYLMKCSVWAMFEKVPRVFKEKSRVKTWQVRGIWSQQYGISQLTSHQCSRALADCFPLSWRHQNMWATLVTGATLHEVLSKFSEDLMILVSKPIRKLTIQIGLACWNWKIKEKIGHKFYVKLFLCFCRKSCPHLGRWLNANLNGHFVIAIWRIEAQASPKKEDGTKYPEG